MATKLCAYTKNDWITHFKRVNLILYDLYPIQLLKKSHFLLILNDENQGILLKGYIVYIIPMSLVQSVSSVTQSCPTLCDPMNRSTPGLPVHHQFPEFTQIYIHRISDAIQPSHPLSSPSPPAPNPSQHQSLFQ